MKDTIESKGTSKKDQNIFLKRDTLNQVSWLLNDLLKRYYTPEWYSIHRTDTFVMMGYELMKGEKLEHRLHGLRMILD